MSKYSATVGVPLSWKMPISGHTLKLTPRRVFTRQTFHAPDSFGAQVERGDVYVGCRFRAGRFALFLEGCEDVLFLDCTFENFLPVPKGKNPEALIRIQQCNRVLIDSATMHAKEPKHAYRIHKDSTFIALARTTISAEGNGFLLGTYGGQVDRDHRPESSHLKDIEIADVVATIQGKGVPGGVDVFNWGREPENIERLRILNLKITAPSRPSWAPPTEAEAARTNPSWSFVHFTRG